MKTVKTSKDSPISKALLEIQEKQKKFREATQKGEVEKFCKEFYAKYGQMMSKLANE